MTFRVGPAPDVARRFRLEHALFDGGANVAFECRLRVLAAKTLYHALGSAEFASVQLTKHQHPAFTDAPNA